MKREDIRVLKINYPKYPTRLEKIEHPPKKLYYLGNPDILKNKYMLAVVGTRMITGYGKQALRYLIPEVARMNIVIVSGLARGVDVYAQKLTVENGGKTIAVMAGGIDEIYPSEHSLFANQIIESGGLIISEHEPGTQYLRQYFPARNRIISGISDAALIVEAKQKSGALITANYALKQNKKLLAVPGDIFSAQSQGVNGLFEKGAVPVQSPEDILKVLFGRKRKITSGHTMHANATGTNLTLGEKQILEQIPYDKSVPLNRIIRKTGLPTAKVVAIATQLEIKGLIENSGGGYVKL